MSTFKYDTVTKYRICAICDGPLHIGSAAGSKEEVLTHPVDGVPFVQASGITGVCRSFCERLQREKSEDDTIIDGLFGGVGYDEGDRSADERSRLRIEDGRFLESSVKMELRPHVCIDRKTGTAGNVKVEGDYRNSGQKYDMEYVGTGSQFTFNAYLYLQSDDANSVLYRELFEAFLSAMNNGEVYIGGKTSSGAGKLRLKEKVKRRIYDLTTTEGRTAWAEELPDTDDGMEECALDKSASISAYTITMNGTTENLMQIKSIAVSAFGQDDPKSENIKNARNEYIIPGSSVKGSFRSRIERIAKYLDLEEVVNEMFGSASEKDNTGKSGNVRFCDVVIKDPVTINSHGIHIDKFTGGVINGGLFIEQNVAGALNIGIEILDRGKPERSLGLLILALRDLAIGSFNLGNGYGKGKGFINVSQISISDMKNNKKAVIHLGEKNEVEDQNEIIKTALASLEKEARK